MEVHQVLRMNEGNDGASYAKNSAGQMLVIKKVKHFLKESIKGLSRSYPDAKCIRIADLGCSSGPNTFLSTENMIESIDEVYHKLGHKPPSIEVFLNDLEGNDFNNIFKLLPNFYDKLEENGRKRGSCFIAAMPGSFYGRLFPENSIHFMHSSYSLHWLSQVPRGLEAESGMRLNKGNICYTITSPPGVHDAYLDEFRKDFTMFLRMRSIEMVPQGHLFLTLQGKIDENDGFDHWVSIGMTLKDMVMEVSFKNTLKELRWFIDSGYSRHVTGDPSLFINLKQKNSGKITIGDDMKAKTIGVGDIGKDAIISG